MPDSYFLYVGKSNKYSLGKTYHLLPFHSLDVAATAEGLLKVNVRFTNDVANLLSLEEDELIRLVCFFIAIHDLGKFATAFQLLFEHNQELFNKGGVVKPYDSKEFRHDRLGYYFWEQSANQIVCEIVGKKFLSDDDLYDVIDALEIILESVLGHHGKPIKKTSFGAKSFTEKSNEIATCEFIKDLLNLFTPRVSPELLLDVDWQTKFKQVSWHLAGLAVLSDWLGSDTDYFPYENESLTLEQYWKTAQQNAQKAIYGSSVWLPIKVKPFLSVREHYGFEPTPLQHWAENVPVDNSPQLFILEDVTGAGKTEAALTLTHRLMQAGAATGFYFGLPTMATSNAMFNRVSNHYFQMISTINGEKPSIVLAHGAREMNKLFRGSVTISGKNDDDYADKDYTATAQCSAWLSDSRKKALLAPVGVGTLDQTLLAVLPRRHQSLRLLGLNQKVLIFDEVHSADEYMLELLESLLSLHLHQGGSAILLTATLSKRQRQRLIDIWADAFQLNNRTIKNTHFPLATKVSSNYGLEEVAVKSCKEVRRIIEVNFLHTESDCINQVLIAASQGLCVVWIRNTVDDALSAYEKISKKLKNPDNCLLFHSRFALKDRNIIENKVLEIFGKTSTNKHRSAKVLIATQVFQESLDVDADVMLSDICPIDDLIQRAGRLHRHTRNSFGSHVVDSFDARSKPVLYVHAPEWHESPQNNWLSKNFQNTEYVYRSPGRLWLGMQVLIKLGALCMPETARQLIEAVYGEDSFDRMPLNFQKKELELLGQQRSKAAKAIAGAINWQQHGYSQISAGGWYEDDTDISTRYSDIETAEVVLLKEDEHGQLVLYAEKELFALQLSTVKLGVNKYVKHLNLISHDDSRLGHLKKQHPNIKFQFLRLWDYLHDNVFGYTQVSGVFKKETGGTT